MASPPKPPVRSDGSLRGPPTAVYADQSISGCSSSPRSNTRSLLYRTRQTTMAVIKDTERLTGRGMEDSRARYEANGAVMVPGLLNKAEVDKIRNTFTSQVESKDRSLDCHDVTDPNDILAKYPRFVHPHRHPHTDAGALARKLMNHPAIWEQVENLIGPAYAAQSMFYFKPPGARGQAMHQDNWFLQAHPETCMAAWVAIDDADEENGGLRVIPGTHKGEVQCHIDADPTISFSKQTVPLPPGLDTVQTRLNAGDVLFFHGSLVHGSMPNSSDRFRRAIIFHYIPKASKEVAKNYQPLIDENGEEVRIDESPLGGPCGDGWTLGEDGQGF